MDTVRISHPQHRQSVSNKFIAAGRADGEVNGVTGQLVRTTPNDGYTVNGKTLFFCAGGRRSDKRPRWVVFFHVPAGKDGEYRLTVTGVTVGGSPPTDYVD